MGDALLAPVMAMDEGGLESVWIPDFKANSWPLPYKSYICSAMGFPFCRSLTMSLFIPSTIVYELKGFNLFALLLLDALADSRFDILPVEGRTALKPSLDCWCIVETDTILDMGTLASILLASAIRSPTLLIDFIFLS